jgi:hypothetical protein
MSRRAGKRTRAVVAVVEPEPEPKPETETETETLGSLKWVTRWAREKIAQVKATSVFRRFQTVQALAASSLKFKMLLVLGVAVAVVVVYAGFHAFGDVFRNNVFAQAMFGSTLLGSCMTTFMSAVGVVKTWTMGILCTTFHVEAASQPTLHQILKTVILKSSKLQMPVATAHLADEQHMTALEKFTAMRKGLAREGGSQTRMVKYTMSPLPLPVLYEYQGRQLLLTVGDRDDITIRVAGRNCHATIAAFLQHVVDNDKRGAVKTEGPTQPSVYLPKYADNGGVSWIQARELRARTKDTVHLPKGLMDTLVQDADHFFTSVDEYERRQQPYRRGWILYGSPGTGKSTAPVVVATELGLPLCILELGDKNITDTKLRDLLNSAPVPSLIVLEDVDAASSITHTRFGDAGKKPEASAAAAAGGGNHLLGPFMAGLGATGVTLAGLLNALDGLGAHEGHLVIMTTNDIERLDPALTRPGRCDVKAHLPLATADQVKAMFMSEFPHATEEDLENFTAIVRPGRYSPCTISEYLTRVRGDLAEALSEPSLATMRVTELGTAVPGVCAYRNLYKLFWNEGQELLFPEALAANAVSAPEYLSTHGSILMTIDPTLRRTAQFGKLAADKAELVEYFLGWFPRRRKEAVEFANRVTDWMETRKFRIGLERIRFHLLMNFDSPELAVGSVYDWLLTYNRAGANMWTPVSVEYMLFLHGVSLTTTPDVFDTLVADLHATNVVVGDEFLAEKRQKWTCIDVLGGGQKSQVEDAKAHARKYFTADNHMVVDRVVIAIALCNAFDDQGCTLLSAMAAARLVTAADGRSGFSREMIAHYITTSESVDVCIEKMRHAQTRFKFPRFYLAAAVQDQICARGSP